MNVIDILNAMAGVAVAEAAAKIAMENDGNFVMYRCALAGTELMDEILMSPAGDKLLRLVVDGDQSEAFDRILTIAEKEIDALDADYEIFI